MVESRSWVVLEMVVRVVRRLGRDLKTIFGLFFLGCRRDQW